MKLNGMRENQIPVDVIWIDIDHMDAFKSYTFNKHLFSENMIAKLCEKYSVKWVPL